MRTVEIFFALLRSAVLEEAPSLPREALTEEVLAPLVRLAKKHDMAHLLAYALDKAGLLSVCDPSGTLLSQQMLAIYRTEAIGFTYEEIKQALEQAAIPFVPLKGSILRAYYPEPFMRTSCDIDILVHKERLKEALFALTAIGYKSDDKPHYHDVSLYAPNGVHLELHFSIKENMPQIDGLLEEAWSYTEAARDKQYEKRQTNEYFLFHHIAHMSYHFLSGGCGVKPFLDLFVMQQKMPYDEAVFRSYLEKCGLERFYSAILSLLSVWFEGAPHTPLTQSIEQYILSGGVYGSAENLAVAKQGAHGGRAKYIFFRLFPSYTFMKEVYPVLVKHPWLYPFMLLRRFFGYLFTGGLRRGKKELKAAGRVSKEDAANMQAFLKELGITKK